ncbi:unnamed protein product [Paramecium octaurelia]|uniref:Uncharacterized protein n=1 Tax=Paramecium octaurelia TaxID=43137 RepID=A0A8S1SQT4_PAROT|nr:unnamed protein product [Paramecium octaurelia]
MVKIKETRILNMRKIYQNISITFINVTYIKFVSLISYVIQRLGQLYYFEIFGAIDIKGKYGFQLKMFIMKVTNKRLMKLCRL